MTTVKFTNIQFTGITSIEPAFNTNVTQYKIHRRAGTDMFFNATFNLPPTKDEHQYPGYFLVYTCSASDSRVYWRCGQPVLANCPVGRSTLDISCVKAGNNWDPNAQDVTYSFSVTTEPMTPEEIQSCVHSRRYKEEGEWWGGASGSCTVEIFTKCHDCGVTLSCVHEYRD